MKTSASLIPDSISAARWLQSSANRLGAVAQAIDWHAIHPEGGIGTQVSVGLSCVEVYADQPTADSQDVVAAHADLSEVDLGTADLHEANLYRADLGGTDLQGADLSGANLIPVILIGANLRWAGLTGSDLTGADLQGADLTQANLFGASLGA
jgi:uncharacterized protein YjbI with pentapeptide repeats